MAKHKHKKSAKLTPPTAFAQSTKISQRSLLLPAIAVVLVVLGAIGLTMALSGESGESTTVTGGQSLEVRDASSQGTQQSREGASSSLQNPARTKDLLQGKDGNAVQQGTQANTLK
jgi:hypothetical protein